MKEVIIEAENAEYIYNEGTADEKKAIGGVSFSVSKGEYIAVMGRNGSGKSTLARLLNGLFVPSKGCVRVKGMDTSDDAHAFDIRSCVGVVFQNPDNQMVASIIEDDIAFGPENLGVGSAEIETRVTVALSAVNMLDHRKGTPFRLSGGQKQRIAIAGILAMKPEVLVLDESTAMLDPRGRNEILDIIDKIRCENGTTVITITHFPEEAARAERILVIDGGKIVMDGRTEDILSDTVRLAETGLEAPVAARIASRLRSEGIDVGKVITGEQLGRALCRLK